MPKIITISGKAQNGKDTFAIFAQDYLQEVHNKKCLIFHYADFLKFICKQYFYWNGVKDEFGRGLLQHVGTDIMRANNPDCWTQMAQSFVSGIGETVDYILIPDARFPNEITCWKDNCFSVYVNRPDFDNGLTESQKNHISENALNDWSFDFVIQNDKGLKEYQAKIEHLIEQLVH